MISALLRRLRGRGVSFSIDDFGIGYSNLGYLKRFEVSRLKIDQSFIRRLTDDRHDEAIVGAIIQMTTSLGLRDDRRRCRERIDVGSVDRAGLRPGTGAALGAGNALRRIS